MAKDVDLSSREWTELIFQGKNKEFGAYELRSKSAKRHNIAMLAVIVFIAAVVIISALASALEKGEADEYMATEQEVVYDATNEEQEDEEIEDEVIQEFEEPEVEEVIPEEILNTVQNTEIIIARDEEVNEEDQVKTQEELQETETAFGSTTFDQGTDDVTVVREHKDEVVVEEKKPAPAPEQIFTAVEEPPTFPGGQEAMYAWMKNNLRYPEMAAQNNIQGKVIIQFVVEKDGSIGEVKVARGRDQDLDKEAVRMVKSMPKFIPGRMNGQSVRVWFTLPVSFKLAGG